MGNEINGVDRNLLDLCDISLEIPQFGAKESLNAAVAFGVDDVEATMRELAAKGVSVTIPAIETPVCHFGCITDPNGNTIDTADHTDPAILYADIDPERARNKRYVRVPDKHEIDRFEDRQPRWYGSIGE